MKTRVSLFITLSYVLTFVLLTQDAEAYSLFNHTAPPPTVTSDTPQPSNSDKNYTLELYLILDVTSNCSNGANAYSIGKSIAEALKAAFKDVSKDDDMNLEFVESSILKPDKPGAKWEPL